MINDDPDARDLVAIALRSFREAILPVVPANQRFTALMIANALGVAERELAAGAPHHMRVGPGRRRQREQRLGQRLVSGAVLGDQQLGGSGAVDMS